MAETVTTENTIEATEEPTVTINGVQKLTKDLDEEQKYFVAQIQDLEVQEKQLKAKEHQVKLAKDAFVNLLVEGFTPADSSPSDPINAGEVFETEKEVQ